MSMLQADSSVYGNYVTFRGRAHRAEYWKYCLSNILITVVFFVISVLVGTSSDSTVLGIGIFPTLLSLFELLSFLHGIAITCRRLHDMKGVTSAAVNEEKRNSNNPLHYKGFSIPTDLD